MRTPYFPTSDSIGLTTVVTFLDESRELRAYRTLVSRAEARSEVHIWSTCAVTPTRAAQNHASGIVQAALVEIDAWLRNPSRGAIPVSVARAGEALGLAQGELTMLRNLSPEQAAARNRELAARRMIELESN